MLILFSRLQYFSLIILIFMAEFMLVALAFVFKDQVGDNMKSQLRFGISEHYTEENMYEPGTFSNFWDYIQDKVNIEELKNLAH